MLKIQKITNIIYYAGVITVFMFGFIFFNIVRASTSTAGLLNKPVFSENEKMSMIIHPSFTDYTTSLILYVSNGDTPETWTYEPETLGSGDFIFSDYFSFGSPTGRYRLIEYVNDGQTFSCYGTPQSDCIADRHFVSQFNFEVTDNNAINPAITVATSSVPDFSGGIVLASSTEATSSLSSATTTSSGGILGAALDAVSSILGL